MKTSLLETTRRGRRIGSALAASLVLAAFAQPLSAAVPQYPAQLHIRAMAPAAGQVGAFYAARVYRPIWIENGRPGAAADAALGLLTSANLDGLDPGKYLRSGVTQAIAQARTGSPDAIARAEILLSQAFGQYVSDVKRPRSVGVIYGEESLKPRPPGIRSVLERAALAPSLRDYVANVGWMHPIYGQLRRELAKQPWEGGVISSGDEMLLRVNLDRASILPADAPRYILVDTTAARLHFIEHGKVRKTMRIVVGTPDQATPMMVGMIRYATLNPYWHVPTDLTRERIAPRVLAEGLGYFTSKGYEVVNEWSRSARVIDPALVDWKAVTAGRTEVFVRQKPGPTNGMGKVKFQFPNNLGIYLHDTPAKQLFAEDQRNYSAGCVRLEDADALGKLLFRGELTAKSGEPEQTISLAQPVPIYITYLTAAPDETGRIVKRADVYSRDHSKLAALKEGSRATGSSW